MKYTSAGFGEQAASDLRKAQDDALASKSGPDLGTAMFSAQQSMEKQLKSIVLRLDEVLGIGLDENFYKKRLGHTFYSCPRDLYMRCLRGIGFPRGLDDRAALESARPGLYDDVKTGYDYLEKLGKTWRPELFDRRTQDLLFQHSLRASLSDDELKELDKYAHNALETVYKDSGFVVLVPRLSNMEPRTGMEAVVSDKSMLEKHRRAYAGSEQLVIEFSNNENLVMWGAQKVRKIRERLESGEISPNLAKRLVKMETVEYAIPSLMMFSRPYLRTYPHLELGRYPQETCNGKTTTDIYASQRDDVLYELFVVADYYHTRISHVSQHVDDFARMCGNIG